MDYNFKLGRISTIFIYILEVIVVVSILAVTKHFDTGMVKYAALCWGIGAVILFMIPTSNERQAKTFVVCQLIFSILMSVWIVEIFENPYILFLLFFLQWMCNLVFLNKGVGNLLTIMHTITMVIFTFVLKRFNFNEFLCSVIVLLCAKWFTGILGDIMAKQKEQNIDHQQSLDDMLALVEVKYDEARSANQAKSSFLANMSHEIRTPINTVLGLDTMILRESKDEEIRKYASNIQTAGQGLLAIINDILDFSKIESGRMEIVPVGYDVASLINDVVNMISVKAKDKGLSFVVDMDSSIPSRLVGDDVRIRQVLINLLTNAVKYTYEGSITLTIKGETFNDHVDIFFSVKDTGTGIKEEDMARLFEKFVRIDEKKNRNVEGTGLGINIVTQLLNLMGSELKVDSVYGKGSDFYFTLRQGIANPEPVGNLDRRICEQPNEYSYEVAYTMPDVNLLVVDDNTMNRMVFTELLKDLKCHIDEADNGNRCLSLVKKKKYDIIFMDHMMPEMDGIETLHCMKELGEYPNKDTPVIILTANAIAGAREQYMEEGFDGYLSKPVNPDKLTKTISSYISDDRKIPERQEPKKEPKKEPAAVEQNVTELPAVEGVDWDYALLKLKDVGLLESVVDDFYVMADNDINELKKMYNQIFNVPDSGSEEAYRQYRVKVHAMKSSAAIIGALNVSSLARVLEYAARDKDEQTIKGVMDVFVREWLHLKELLGEAFGFGTKNENGSKKTIDNEMFHQYLGILSNAMKELDTDTADAVVEELLNYDYNEDGTRILNELIVAVRNLDIDTSLKLIGEWEG
ncbi:MAG: response regulator [Lachnospiraceae bacterium]